MAKTLTLAEYAQLAKDPVVKKLINETLKDSTSIFDLVPFADVNTLTTRNQTRKGAATGHAFRPIGQESYADLNTGGVEDVFGDVFDVGGRHTIDKVRMMDKNMLRDPRAFEMERAREGMLRLFNKQFILGTANDPDGFRGLDDWLAENTAQDVSWASSPVFAAGGVDTFVDNLHTMWDYVDGKPDVILTNRKAKQKISSALRRSNYLSVNTDQYERKILSFDGVPFIDAGTKGGEGSNADTTDYIIPYDLGAEDHETYLYAVKFGPDHVTGLQMEPLTVEDIGFTTETDKTVYKILIHWIVGTMITHRFSVARFRVDFDAS